MVPRDDPDVTFASQVVSRRPFESGWMRGNEENEALHVPESLRCCPQSEVVVNAREARKAALAWVDETARTMPGYRASFLAGSITSLPDSAIVPPWMDTDIMVVVDGDAPAKAGKFRSSGALLEGTFLSHASLADPEVVLGSYHTANALATGAIIGDPTGWLVAVQATVRREFPRRHRVEIRCAHARARVEAGFAALAETGSLAERAQAWVFPTGVLTHILLVAGLRNPTVRRRYETVHELLGEHRRLDLHERLLEVLGCQAMDRVTVERHLETVTRLFDAAAPVQADSYRFSSDISEIARPISIDGSRDMIARGFHREAVFWLVVTGSRALQKLQRGPEPCLATPFEGGFADLLADLGIRSFDDLLGRRDRALDLLPDVWDAALGIIDATPEIVP